MLPTRFSRPTTNRSLPTPLIALAIGALIVLVIVGFGAATMGTPPAQSTITNTLSISY